MNESLPSQNHTHTHTHITYITHIVFPLSSRSLPTQHILTEILLCAGHHTNYWGRGLGARFRDVHHPYGSPQNHMSALSSDSLLNATIVSLVTSLSWTQLYSLKYERLHVPPIFLWCFTAIDLNTLPQ